MSAKKSSLVSPRPLPRIARFEKLGYGLFLHWGLYSQLGQGEWIQFQQKMAVKEYARLFETFDAAGFDAPAIAGLAREGGMRYAVLTTRHHEGFSLYDTRGLSPFDAVRSPARRDLVREFAESCRAEGIVPFFYHTTLDWRWDSARCRERKFNEYLDYLHASVEILCRDYGPIGGLWFDGNWSRPDADWKEDRLYAVIRKYQPEAIIVNNTGLHARGALGHPELDSTTFEQGLPAAPDRRGWPKYLAGEMCETMNSHWGIGNKDLNSKSPAEIIRHLCACRKVGANYLLNVGHTAADVPSFRDSLVGQLSVASINHAVKIVRIGFSAAQRAGLMQSNPAMQVENLHSKQKHGAGAKVSRRPFTMPELRKILDVADQEWKDLILFGLYTGQRLGDLSTLSWENVDLAQEELRFVSKKTGI